MMPGSTYGMQRRALMTVLADTVSPRSFFEVTKSVYTTPGRSVP